MSTFQKYCFYRNSSAFFSKKQEVTDESEWYCEASKSRNYGDVFKVHASCLYDQINEKNEEIRKLNNLQLNHKFLSLFGEQQI